MMVHVYHGTIYMTANIKRSPMKKAFIVDYKLRQDKTDSEIALRISELKDLRQIC